MKIKYQVIGKDAAIKSVAIKENVIALSSGQSDEWLKLFVIDQHFEFQPIPLQNMEKRSISIMHWSPTSFLLATAYDKLTISELKNGQLETKKVFQDTKLDISSFCWSPDGTRIAMTSIDRKLNVYNVETGIQIYTEDLNIKGVGVIWDPLDKYLAILKFDNKVDIKRVDNWETVFLKNLLHEQGAKNYNTKREDRKLDWSPDCRYLLVPGLDDRLVPSALLLDRTADFDVTFVFVGPFSSINALKFNPMIRRSENDEILNYIAIGDNDGNLSIWKVHNGMDQDDGPFVFVKSHQNSNELIEDIDWSSDGSYLVATTAKKYIILMKFEDTLGQKLDTQEKNLEIEKLFGSITIQNDLKKIRIFNRDFNKSDKKRNDEINENKIENDNKQVVIAPLAQNGSASTQQQPIQNQFRTIFENGKKKMIPISIFDSMVQEPKQQQHQQMIMPEQPFFELRAISCIPREYIYVFPKQKNRYLVFEQIKVLYGVRSQIDTIIKCYEDKQLVWKDYVEGQIRHVASSDNRILIYTDNNYVYLENFVGQRQDCPLIIPYLAYIAFNDQNQIFTLTTSGGIKVIDLNTQKLYMDGDIKELMKIVGEQIELKEEEQKGKVPTDPVYKTRVITDEDGFPIPEILMRDCCLYRYSRKLQLWQKTNCIDVSEAERYKYTSNLPQYADSVNYNKLFSRSSLTDARQDLQQIAKIEEQMKTIYDHDELNQLKLTYVQKVCDTLPNNSAKLINFLKDQRNMEMEFIKKVRGILGSYPETSKYQLIFDPNLQ